MKNFLPQRSLTLILFFFMLMCMQLGSAQTIIPEFTNLQTNGSINAIQIDEANGNIYVGGSFTRIGNRTSYGGAVDDVNGDQSYFHALPNGDINVVKSDGSGGYFIAGDFTMIGSTSRNGLAHINAAGALSSWDPNPNNDVLDIVVSGSTVYVGGGFTTIGGQSRARVAALDATTGLATSWNPGSNGNVQQLAVAGGFVYAFSPFANFMGGESIDRLAKISTSTGAADASWNPSPAGTVSDMIVDGSNLYIGGHFTSIGGVTRNRLAAIDTSTGALTSWDPDVSAPVNGSVSSLAIHGGNLYAGGFFSTVGGQTVDDFVKIDLTTGAASSFSSNASGVTTLNVSGNSLYIGAFSFTIGGVTRDGVSEIDLTTDLFTAWNPGLDRAPNTMAISGSNIYMGGTSSFVLGGERRNNLASFELADGTITSWNPDADGTINDLALTSTSIYVAGSFDNVGGQVRDNLAEILKSNGLATSFDPDVASTVDELLLSGDQLFVGGSFTSVGGGSRNRLAVYDITDGSLSSWNPNFNNIVQSLATDGSTLYVGGNFTTASGTSRSRIAAYDIVTESLTSWNPGASDRVESLATGIDGTVYAGGRFSTIGGLSRTRFASIDPTTGAVNALDIALSWIPYTIEPSPEGTVYVGGGFATVNGASQPGAFAFNSTTGAVLDWDAQTQANVFAIAPKDFSVYLGGNFSSVLGESTGDFAGVSRANGAPVSFTLPDNAIPENAAVGTSVGIFTVSDDAGDTHTYSLVAGAGGDDNADFVIDNTSLDSNAEFDFEAKNTYNIRARVTDDKGNFAEQAFVVNVSNVIETGTDITAFSISGQVGSSIIDDVNHSVLLDMGAGTDVSSLIPTISASSGATISPLSGVSQDFTSVVTYTVTAEDGSMQDWDVSATTRLQAGTYSIGSAADYTSVITGLTVIRDNGISGDVIFEIEDGYTDTWNSTLVLDAFDGTDSYSVTITVADGATAATISAASASLIARDIKNFIIDGKGVLEFQSSSVVNTAMLTFSRNFTSMVAPENIEIKNAKFSTQRNPITFSTANNVSVSGNEFSFLDNSATYRGFFSSVRLISVDGADIYNNKIQYVGAFDHLGSSASGEGKLHGIDVQTTGSDINIYNNSIHLNPINARNTVGINVGGISSSLTIDHNTILIEGANSIDGISRGIDASVNGLATILRIRNNIVSITRNNLNGDEKGIDHATPTDYTISHNSIFITDDGGTEDYINNFELSDLSALLAGAPGTTVTQPTFTSPSLNDLTLSGASLSEADFRGVPIAGITDDLDGSSRSTFAPSRGTYESPNNIATITDISFPEQDGDEVIDDVNFTVTAEAIANTPLNDLSPVVTVFSGASVTPTSGSSQNFSSGVVYTVTSEMAGNSQPWTINISEKNEIPTDISLSNAAVDENETSGTTVGLLSSTDANTSQSHSYQLVSGSGDVDNSAFTIDGNELKTGSIFDFETDASYSIRIQTDDGNGGQFQKEFTIMVDNVFESPTDLSLSASSINENNAINATIGTLSTTDEDAGETYTYSLASGSGDADNASFNISGNLLRASEAFNFESKASYSIRLQTDDGNGGLYAEEFTVTINDVSETPTDIALSASSITENNAVNATVGNLSTTDEDAGETFTYTLVSGSGDADNASFNISGNALRASIAFDFEGQSTYSVRVQTDDGNGGTIQEAFSISITNQSESPTDLALSSADIDESSPVGSTVGTLSTVDEDNGETYTYTLVSGTGSTDNASFSISGNELQSAEIFDFETKTSYTVRVETNDGNGGLLEEAFTISINNLPPGLTGVGITSTSIDENLSSGSSVGDLFALGDEIDGVSFTFALVSGAGDSDNGLFSISANTLQTVAAFDFESINQYSIRVMADDGAGATIDQIILIDVNDVNEAPTDVQLSASSLNENNATNETIGSFSTTDEDTGDTHSYSLVSGSGDEDNSSFEIAGSVLQASEIFDFEAQSSYSIRVQSSDGNGGILVEVFSISIVDQNDEPTALMLDVASIDENNTVGATVGAFSTTDQDGGDSFSYSLVSGSGDDDNGSFSLAGNQLQAGIGFDFETKNSYAIRIQTNDGNGGLLVETFTITVNDANENPTDIALSSTNVEESNPIGTTIGSLSTIDEDAGQSHTYSLVSGAGDADNASFTLSGSDILSAEVFDFETKSSYSIRVRTEDGNGGTYEESLTISIDDLPASITSFTLSNASINENEASGSLIGSFSTSGEDLSGSYTYTFASGLGDTDNASFAISANQLQTAAVFDFETKSSYSVLLMTDDGTGNTREEIFTISVNDVSEAPTALALNANSITENNAVNDLIGTLSSIDQDAGETFTYSLVSGTGDTDNNSFAISGNELQASEVFDFEAQSSYDIRLQTDDGNGGTFQQEFTITIVNENEAPTVPNVLSDVTVTEGFVSSQRSLATAFVDPDGDALTLTASSNDESIATPELQGTTLVITGSGLGTVVITVTANDGNGGTVSTSFNFTIEAAAQAPPTAIALSSTSIDENEPVNTEVAQISSTDINPTDDAVYTFVAGEGDDDNASFTISGSQLLSNEVFDFDTKSSYSVRLQVDDLNGGTFQEAFTISINDLGDNEAPTVAISLPDFSEVVGFGTTDVDLSSTFSDVDGDALTLSVVSSDINVSTASIAGNILTLTEVGVGTSAIAVTAEDGNGGSVSDSFTITVNEESNSAPIVVSAIADEAQEEGFGTFQISYATTFEDADGDDLIITVSSSDETVVTATVVAGNQIQIDEVGIGTSTITVTADDGNGGMVSAEFAFSVSEVLNNTPTVVNPIGDQTSLIQGFTNFEVNYSTVFEDADGDDLTISVASSDETVVIATVVANSQIKIDEVGIGTSTITITADDGNGGMVSDEFIVTVSEVANNAPTVVDPIDDQTILVEGFDAFQVNYSTTFADADGDDLTITVASSDETVVTATVIQNNQIQVDEVGIGTSTITVTADDGNGGIVSDEFIVKVSEAPLGLEDQIEISVYPNPAIDFLIVKSSSKVEATLVTSDGKKLIKGNGTDLSLDLRSLGSGMYILLVNDGNTVTKKRIIKAN